MRYFAVMDIETWAAILGAAVAVVSAVVSWLGANASRKHEKVAAEAATRVADIEQKREDERHAAAKIAKMEPELSSKGRNSGYYQLIVRNNGPAKAENLRIWLGENLDLKGHFAQVESGSVANISLSATVPGGQYPPYLVKLAWSDGRGRDQVWGPQRVYDLGE